MLGAGPLLVILDVFALVATERELDVIVRETVGVEDLRDQIECLSELFADLLFRAEDVAIILRQRTDAGKAAQLAALLVSVKRRELGIA